MNNELFNSSHRNELEQIWIRWRSIPLKFCGIYMLFIIFFWIQNTFKTYPSLLVGLSFQIFLIQITKNFCITFHHSENSSSAWIQNTNKHSHKFEKSQVMWPGDISRKNFNFFFKFFVKFHIKMLLTSRVSLSKHKICY